MHETVRFRSEPGELAGIVTDYQCTRHFCCFPSCLNTSPRPTRECRADASENIATITRLTESMPHTIPFRRYVDPHFINNKNERACATRPLVARVNFPPDFHFYRAYATQTHFALAFPFEPVWRHSAAAPVRIAPPSRAGQRTCRAHSYYFMNKWPIGSPIFQTGHADARISYVQPHRRETNKIDNGDDDENIIMYTIAIMHTITLQT